MSKLLAIQTTLESVFHPEVCEVVNESDQHSGPPGRESHFKVVLVSDAFQGMGLLARHKAVYAALSAIMPTIHALSLYTYTKDQWASAPAPQSPVCAGKKLPPTEAN